MSWFSSEHLPSTDILNVFLSEIHAKYLKITRDLNCTLNFTSFVFGVDLPLLQGVINVASRKSPWHSRSVVKLLVH